MPDAAFSIAKDWLARLYDSLQKIRSSREKEFQKIADTFGDPLELVRFYVQPDCQQFSPADEDEDESAIVIRQPMLATIEKYISSENNNSKRQMFVLSDAGMGKTSLLVMLKLSHLTSFWPKGYQCELLKLGRATISSIDRIADKPNTVLLLDALDEDPMAWKDTSARIRELLSATTAFKRVIITCRTQFFSGDADPFNRKGLVQVSGFLCPAIFNSLFSNEQVEEYLNRRSETHEDRDVWLDKAVRVVEKMGSLRMRPMLLAHIEDFVESDEQRWNQYTIYRTLVSAWLLREQRKLNAKEYILPQTRDLWLACHWVAMAMQESGHREISPTDLRAVIKARPETKYIQVLDVGGRSLLNRDSMGKYRFSHYSIQEFLLLNAILEHGLKYVPGAVRKTHLTSQFFDCWLEEVRIVGFGAFHHKPLPWDLLPGSSQLLRQIDLSHMTFRGLSLVDADFGKSILHSVDFRSARIPGASFIGADIELTNFEEVDSTGAVFQGRLTNSKFCRASLQKSVFANSSVTDCDYTNADLTSADFKSARAARVKFNNANASLADFTDCNVSESSFSKAELSSALFKRSVLVGTTFSDANLDNASFSQARAAGTYFTNVLARNANFDDCDVPEVSFASADLTNASFKLAKATGADFASAIVCSVDFSAADLTNASFKLANAKEANFANAELVSVDFNSAKLTSASFKHAKAKDADFTGAQLCSVDFSAADLTNATFKGADFGGAKLYSVDLSTADLAGAFFKHAEFDDKTKWPVGVDPTVLGAVNRSTIGAASSG